MAELYLLRHAKAEAASPGTSDFDRPLDPVGRREAEGAGHAMREGNWLPQHTLCSPARRTRETLAQVSLHANPGATSFIDSLYTGDAEGYLAAARRCTDARSLLIVGHNPMIEHLSTMLCEGGDDRALARLRAGFPTAGLAVIRFDCAIENIGAGLGSLQNFIAPAER